MGLAMTMCSANHPQAPETDPGQDDDDAEQNSAPHGGRRLALTEAGPDERDREPGEKNPGQESQPLPPRLRDRASPGPRPDPEDHDGEEDPFDEPEEAAVEYLHRQTST
jgi:hypothetical protein